jgi:hypothetical protein
LPYWLDVLQKCGYQVRPICAIRAPLSVARSLQERDFFSIHQGSLLYTSHWISAWQSLEGTTPSFVSYERVVSDPKRSLVGLSVQLGLPLPDDWEERLSAFEHGFLVPELRQHLTSSEVRETGSQLCPAAVDIHATLLHAEEKAVDVLATRKRLRSW